MGFKCRGMLPPLCYPLNVSPSMLPPLCYPLNVTPSMLAPQCHFPWSPLIPRCVDTVDVDDHN